MSLGEVGRGTAGRGRGQELDKSLLRFNPLPRLRLDLSRLGTVKTDSPQAGEVTCINHNLSATSARSQSERPPSCQPLADTNSLLARTAHSNAIVKRAWFSNQLANGIKMLEQVLRSPCGIDELSRSWIDSDVVIKCR
jgi:hypothetical protein